MWKNRRKMLEFFGIFCEFSEFFSNYLLVYLLVWDEEHNLNELLADNYNPLYCFLLVTI